MEKSYEKQAWVLLAAIGVIGLLFAILRLLDVPVDTNSLQNQLGQSISSFSASNPKAYSAFLTSRRDTGAAFLGFSILTIFVSSTAFRKGEKWAWFAELYLPPYVLFSTAESYALGGTLWPLFAVFLLISLAGLILPYRKFFPKKQLAFP